MNTSSTSRPPGRTHRTRLAVLAVAAVGLLVLAVIIAVWAISANRPNVPTALYLSPAAAPVNDDSQISVSGLGWRAGEQVAICLVADSSEACSAENALLVSEADAQGALQATVDAGQWLQQGFTTVLAQGLDSGAFASRIFRVLVAPERAVIASNAVGDSSLPGETPVADGTVNLPLIVSGEGGWQGDYFDNPNLAGEPVLQRVDNSLSMNWGNDAPAPSLPTDGFSARWTTRAPFLGRRYIFNLTADGGVRLYVDGQIVIDRWRAEPGLVSGYVDLLPGEHDVVVEYFNDSGPAFISGGWAESNDYPDWRGEYFASSELTGAPELIRNDPAVNFNWGRSGPAPGVLTADSFAARWTRSLEFVEGTYRWAMTADDGARLLVDGQVVLDAWQGQTGQEVTAETRLDAGLHTVVVELHNAEGPGGIALGWTVVIAEETPTPEATSGPTVEPTATPDQPTATPDPSVESTATPTDTPTVVPGSTAPPTATDDPNMTATPTATHDPNATLTPTPTVTPTPTNGASGSSTTTPTPSVTATSTQTPEAMVHPVDISPFFVLPGTQVTLTTGDWTPGTRVTVALVEDGQPFSQAVEVSGTALTTPSNSAQGFSIQFDFPTDSRWQLESTIRIIIHNSSWTEVASDVIELREEG